MGRLRSGRTGLATAAATALVLAGAAAPASAAAPVMTLNSATGPSGGANAITATVPTASATTFVPGSTPTIQFQYYGTGATSCSATARETTQIAVSGTTTTAGVLTVDPDSIVRISYTKVAFTVPSVAYPTLDESGNPSTVNPDGLVLAEAQTSAKWNICAYDSDSTTSSTLLATASYTLARRPTITSIIPASSPAGGGQSITVTGTGFSSVVTGVTASIDGIDLTDISVASNGNSFTATTGSRVAGTDLALIVNAPGGTVSSLDPDDNGQPEDNDPDTNDARIPFTYSNGITITPNTAPAGTTVDIDVIGAGFSELTFDAGGAPQDDNAHVFLVEAAYDASSNRGVAECVVAMVVSDSELICTLDLTADQLSPEDSSVVPGTPIDEGAYILTVVATGDPAADTADVNATIVSSGATFTIGAY